MFAVPNAPVTVSDAPSLKRICVAPLKYKNNPITMYVGNMCAGLWTLNLRKRYCITA